MKIFLSAILLLYNFALSAQNIPVIPEPNYYAAKDGFFKMDNNIQIDNQFNNKQVTQTLANFSNYLKEKHAITITQKNGESAQFVILQNSSVENPEGYELTISEDKIEVIAADNAGVFYALQTLKQILFFSENQKLPCLEIKDAPAFKWRGLLLDVSRHFIGVEEIKRLLDVMAFYKLNVFHWHLTDNEGWRIEIKKYPKLTETGAKGDRSNPDKIMFYTQEQIREIVAYAKERGIETVPEIDVPGHSMAASKSYPFLKCTPDDNGAIYCAGKESTFQFIDNVLKEVVELFPSEYIHIGGDEAWKGPWEKCPDCQKRMQDEGLKNVNELQSYFIKRLEKILNSYGKKLIGWGEISEGGLAKSATVQSWQGVGAALEATREGHDVIMSSKYAFYFGKAQSDNRYTEPPAWRQTNSLETTYNEEIIHESIPYNLRHHVIGGEGALWTECISTEEKLQFQAFPRTIALAENLWSNSQNKNFELFAGKLIRHFEYLENEKINYRFPATVNIKQVNNKVVLKTELPFTEIRYTLDGSEPDTDSPVYKEPLEINKSLNLKASTVWNNKCLRSDSKVIADFIPRKKQKIIKCTSETAYHAAQKSIDSGATGYDVPGKAYPTWNFWLSNKKDGLPVELIFDFGSKENISGFEYKPRNDGIVERITEGNILEFEIYTGDEPEKVTQKIFTGKFTGKSKTEFVIFETVKSRYLKLVITKGVSNQANIADIRFFR
jgi:hexosaminidase